MAIDYRQLVAKNVRALKDANPRLSSNQKIADEAKRLSRGAVAIGARTIGHVTNGDGPSPSLETLAAIAMAFRIDLSTLLSPELDPRLHTQEDVRVVEDLAEQLRTLTPAQRALLQKINSATPVQDDDARLIPFSAAGKKDR
jgi:transcriptional regulator with XRE-family HTH domain